MKRIAGRKPVLRGDQPNTSCAGNPLKVLEDGKVRLKVILPDGSTQHIVMGLNVPMMDLLIRICSKFNLNPTGVILNMPTDRHPGYLNYKPSSLVSSLKSDVVMVVPKFYADKPSAGLNLKDINDLRNDDLTVVIDLPHQPSVAYRTQRGCTVGTLVEAVHTSGRLAVINNPLIFAKNDLTTPLDNSQLLVNFDCKHFALYPKESYQQRTMIKKSCGIKEDLEKKLLVQEIEKPITNAVKKRLAPKAPMSNEQIAVDSSELKSIIKRKGKAPPPPPPIRQSPPENGQIQSLLDDSDHLKPPTLTLQSFLSVEEQNTKGHIKQMAALINDTTDSGIHCTDDTWVKTFPPALQLSEQEVNAYPPIKELQCSQSDISSIGLTESVVDIIPPCQHDNEMESISHCDDERVDSPFVINPALSPFREVIYHCDKQSWTAGAAENSPRQPEPKVLPALHVDVDLANLETRAGQSMPRTDETSSPASSIRIHDPRKDQYPRMVVKCFEEEYYSKQGSDDYVNFIRYGYQGEQLPTNRQEEPEKNANPYRNATTVSRVTWQPAKDRTRLPCLRSSSANLEEEFDKMQKIFENWKQLKNSGEQDEQKLAKMKQSFRNQQNLVQEMCTEMLQHSPKSEKLAMNILQHLKGTNMGNSLKSKMDTDECDDSLLKHHSSYKSYREFLIRHSPTEELPRSPMSVTPVSSEFASFSVGEAPLCRLSPTDVSPTQEDCLQKALMLEEMKSFGGSRNLKKTTVGDRSPDGSFVIKRFN